MMVRMSMSVDVHMVGPARPLADALSDILQRWEKIGYIRRDPVYSVGEDEEKIDFTGDWAERVNALEGLSFGANRVGPSIDAYLGRLGSGLLEANFCMHERQFVSLYAARTLPENYYAPILQAALALGARYGVGGLHYGLDPVSEEEVEAQIWTNGTLGFVRFDAASAEALRAKDLRASSEFTMNARPEGYWWLECPSFFDLFKP
jgi:hypothetical protein